MKDSFCFNKKAYINILNEFNRKITEINKSIKPYLINLEKDI